MCGKGWSLPFKGTKRLPLYSKKDWHSANLSSNLLVSRTNNYPNLNLTYPSPDKTTIEGGDFACGWAGTNQQITITLCWGVTGPWVATCNTVSFEEDTCAHLLSVPLICRKSTIFHWAILCAKLQTFLTSFGEKCGIVKVMITVELWGGDYDDRSSTNCQ